MTRSLSDVDVFPASYGQQRLWFLCQLDPSASRAYHLGTAVRVHGPLDVDALRVALAHLVARHEPLRTRFELIDAADMTIGDQLAQIVDHTARAVLTEVDLTGRDAAEIEAAIRAERDRPFDLGAGPLLRAWVACTGPADHVLLLTAHHIVGYGWSMAVLGDELSRAYAACVRGAEPDLADLPIQYADFAEWQRDQVADGTEGGIAYWTDALAGMPALELPTDRPRPMRQSYRGARLSVDLGAQTSAAVSRFARAAGATEFMVATAAFEAVLGRLSGQDDFGVGTPVAGRTRPELEPLIGFFVNTVVLRADLSGDPSLRTLLGRVRDTALEGFLHQDTPFEKLVERLVLDRDLSRPPLFQTSIAMQNTPAATLTLAGTEVEAITLPSATATFDLTLALRPDQGGIVGALEYNSDLFDEATARRIGGYWTALLEAGIDAPDEPIGDLWTPSPGDEAILRHLDGPPAPRPATLPGLIAESAAARPQAVAIRDGEAAITYGELMQRVHRLAGWLAGRGVRRGDVVAVSLPRGIDMVAMLLATWSAGSAYLPLDPDFPPERRTFMTADAGAALVVTLDLLAEAADDIAAQPADTAPVTPTSEDLAYLIYTSGSTGKPKGTLISHRAIAALVTSMAEALCLDEHAVWAALTTVSFDIAALELFGPLTTGGCVTLVARSDLLDPVELQAALGRIGATHAQATPTLWRSLTATGWRPDPSLRLVTGGEALPPELAADLTSTGAGVWNAYGPTETTVWSTLAVVTPGAAVTLGRVLPGERGYVLDERLRRVPPGAAGELYIGGVGVARGYHGRPGLTAQRFRADPYRPGERIYRTGDLVRLRADGELAYLGRIDQQVKLRGHRIELGEIEAVLAQHPGVAAAATRVHGSGAGAVLAGYVIAADPQDPPASAELSDHLAHRLPAVMVPGAWAVVAEFPHTPNGKLDRAALAPIVSTGAVDEAPSTALQARILDIWQWLLRRENIGVRDNFFHLGGHSMLAAQLVGEIDRALGVRLSVAQIFVLGTVEQIATALETPPSPQGPPAADLFEADLDTMWDAETAETTDDRGLSSAGREHLS